MSLLDGLVANTYMGQVHVISLKKFMRLVQRKVRALEGGSNQYIFNLLVQEPKYCAAPENMDPNADVNEYQRIPLDIVPIDQFQPDLDLSKYTVITEVDPRAKRPPIDILESLVAQLHKDGVPRGIGGCVFRIAPRTWVLASPSDFTIYLSNRTDKRLGAGIIPNTRINCGTGVRIRRLREVV
jgi:hypothetical protein